MSKFPIESKYNLAYKIASLVSDSLDVEHGEKVQHKYFWIWRADFEDELKASILEKFSELKTPKKETFLHDYIYNFYFAYFDYQEFWFLDDYYNWKIEDIIIFFEEKYISRLKVYDALNNSDINFINSIYQIFRESNNENLHDELKDVLNLYFHFLGNKLEDEKLMYLIGDEVFSLLFINKNFLFNYSKKMANIILELKKENQIDKLVQRPSYLPIWLKNAIFYRDRGTCQNCFKDLSNSISLLDLNELHYDHIIPLEKGGTNDPTNFQLLCKTCNKNKGIKLKKPKRNFVLYWERDNLKNNLKI